MLLACPLSAASAQCRPTGACSGRASDLNCEARKQVNLIAHSDAHGTPDAVFPNNWFSTHYDAIGGTTVLYPMKAPNRQAERRADIIAMLQHGKRYYSRHLSYAAVSLLPLCLHATFSWFGTPAQRPDRRAKCLSPL
jgi:hypothetical protein